MSLETKVSEAITEAKKVFDLVKNQFSKWDGQVKAKINNLENWKTANQKLLQNNIEVYDVNHCTNSYQGDGDDSAYLHVLLPINADAHWQPKLIELIGQHNYTNGTVTDFLAVVNTEADDTFKTKIIRNNSSEVVIYRSNNQYNGCKRVCVAIKKAGCCCIGRLWLKIYHSSGGINPNLDLQLAGKNDANPFF